MTDGASPAILKHRQPHRQLIVLAINILRGIIGGTEW
jgi:hypothetical protein